MSWVRVIDDLQAELLVTAIALEQWHQRHTHCPRCGTATHESDAGWTRTCPRDGSQHFPRTDPAVIMLIHDGGDRALLGRGAQWPAGRFSTLAGFVEPGESLEAAVAREVGEEVGVAITDIRYVASQPWPFPSSLMLGFTARVDGEDSIELDLVEMAEAAWFTRAEVQRAADHVDGLAEHRCRQARLQYVSPATVDIPVPDRLLAGGRAVGSSADRRMARVVDADDDVGCLERGYLGVVAIEARAASTATARQCGGPARPTSAPGGP